MLTLADIQELLGLEVLGVVPESKAVLTATNLGQPVIMTEGGTCVAPIEFAIDKNSSCTLNRRRRGQRVWVPDGVYSCRVGCVQPSQLRVGSETRNGVTRGGAALFAPSTETSCTLFVGPTFVFLLLRPSVGKGRLVWHKKSIVDQNTRGGTSKRK